MSCCPRLLLNRNEDQEMRVIGLDVHRRFAQIAELKEGVLRQRGRLDLVRHKILEFARTLDPDDEVVLEATGNTMAIVRLLKPHVGKVIIANPLQVRIIADAKVRQTALTQRYSPACMQLGICPRSGSQTRRRRVCAAWSHVALALCKA
jgi:hypothetical protein